MANNEKLMMTRGEFTKLMLTSPLLFLGLTGSKDHEPHQNDAIHTALLESGMNPENPYELVFLYGSHHTLPQDADYSFNAGEFSAGVSPNISRLVTEILNQDSGVLTQKPSEQISSTDGAHSRFYAANNSGSSPSSIPNLGYGGTLSPETKSATQRAFTQRHTHTVATDTFGRNYWNDAQKLANLKVTAAEMLLLQTLAFQRGETAVLQALANASPIRFPEAETKAGLYSRRAILQGGAAAMTVAATLGINELATNGDIMQRDSIDPHFAGLFTGLVAELPSEILSLVDEDTQHLFDSAINIRNYNMALNLISTAVALSHSDVEMPDDDHRIFAKAGLFHMNLENVVRQGEDEIVAWLEETTADIASYYARALSEAETIQETQYHLENFLFIAKCFSLPVYEEDIFLDQAADLPDSGMAILWKTLIDQTIQAYQTEDQPLQESYSLLGHTLAAYHQAVGTMLPGRDYEHFTNAKAFDYEQSAWWFTQPLQDVHERYYAVCFQNNIPYILDVVFYDDKWLLVWPEHSVEEPFEELEKVSYSLNYSS